MTTPARRTNGSAVAAAQQSTNRTISLTLSPALSDALESFGKPAGCSIEDVCEYWLFYSFHHPECEDSAMNVPASALVSEGARLLAAICADRNQRPGAARAGGEHWSAAEQRRAYGMVPDRGEMELAIIQAEGLIELIASKAGAALKENGGYVADATESGIIELASATCRRLHAAFHGRAD